MVFCNNGLINAGTICVTVTILILIDGFLQYQEEDVLEIGNTVTILILIDGFLQCETKKVTTTEDESQSLF